MNFHGSYIDVVGADNTQDRFYDTNSQLDVSVTQKITRNLRVYVEPAQPERLAAALLPGRARPRRCRKSTTTGGSNFGVKVEF